MHSCLSRIRKNRTAQIGAVLFVVALLPRLFALDFGLPHQYLEDEEFFVPPAVQVAEGHLNPGWYGTPNHPHIYAMGAGFRILNSVLNVGAAEKLPVTLQYKSNPTPFHLFGRTLTAIAGALISVTLYLIARRWSERVGVIAGVLSALNAFAIYHSHIIRPDIIQTSFLALALLFLLRILHTPTRKSEYIWLGIFFGLALTTKYPSLFFFPTILVVAAVAAYRKKFVWRRWLSAIFSTIAAVLISAPALFIHIDQTWHAVLFENRTTHSGHDNLGFIGNFIWYIVNIFHWQVGTLIFITTLTLCIASAAYLIYKRRWTKQATDLAVIIFASITYTALLSMLSLHWERWLIPATTLFLLVAAWCIDYIFKKAKQPLLIVLIACIFFIAPLARVYGTLHALAQPDTRDTAREWIHEHIPAPAHFIGEPYTPDPGAPYTYTQYPNLSWGSTASYRKQGATHFLTTNRVEDVIIAGVPQDHPAAFGINELAQPKYTKLHSKTERIHTVLPSPIYSPQELLESADWYALRNFTQRMQYGPEIRIYTLLPRPE